MAFWDRKKPAKGKEEERAEIDEAVDANALRRLMARQATAVATQAEVLRIEALKLKELVENDHA